VHRQFGQYVRPLPVPRARSPRRIVCPQRRRRGYSWSTASPRYWNEASRRHSFCPV